MSPLGNMAGFGSAEFSSARLATHLARRIDRLRRRCRRCFKRCREDFSEDAVHELRIQTRRMLALLDVLEMLRAEGPLRKLRKSYKKRLDAFDDLRDTQVHLRLLKPMRRRFSDARRLVRVFQSDEQRLVSKLKRKIKTTEPAKSDRRLKKAAKSLSSIVKPDGPGAGAESALRVLRGAFEHVCDLRRRVRAHDLRTIHQLRLAFKRYRYLCEMLRPLLPGFPGRRLARMREYQAAAGLIQDLRVIRAKLAKIDRKNRGKGKPRSASLDLQARLFRSALAKRQKEAIAAFLSHIDDLYDFQPNPVARAPSRTARFNNAPSVHRRPLKPGEDDERAVLAPEAGRSSAGWRAQVQRRPHWIPPSSGQSTWPRARP